MTQPKEETEFKIVVPCETFEQVKTVRAILRTSGFLSVIERENEVTEPKESKTVANDVETARQHHRQHGDMDGHTCLLSECALHYPKEHRFTATVKQESWNVADVIKEWMHDKPEDIESFWKGKDVIFAKLVLDAYAQSQREEEKKWPQREPMRILCNNLLLMLDHELTLLEHEHKTGTPYWKRLRVRKRLVQTLLCATSQLPNWKNANKELSEEFFKTSDKILMEKLTDKEKEHNQQLQQLLSQFPKRENFRTESFLLDSIYRWRDRVEAFLKATETETKP